MRRIVTVLLATFAALVALVALVVVAWLVDGHRHDGRVMRNVTLADRPVGGLRPGPLEEVVRRVTVLYEGAGVRVEAPRGSFSADATDLGISVQRTETAQRVMAVGRSGPPLERLAGWVRSFAAPRAAPVELTAVAGRVWEVVAEKDKGPRRPPVEPSVKEEEGRLVAVPGRAGRGIDPRDVIRALPQAARDGVPLRVRVDRGRVPPRFSLADAQRVAEEGERLTAAPLPLATGETTARATPEVLRDWVTAQPRDEGLVFALDEEETLEGLRRLLAAAGTPPLDARFVVEGDAVRLLPGTAGTACCGSDAVPRVFDALRNRPRGAVTVPLKRVDPDLTTEEASKLGVKEKIGSFTTQHKAGEPRVRNIHRIADMVRGTLIRPGKTYSVNDAIGRRTREKGYVVAPVIENGMLAEDVGGGISQFATTLFNTAFFAGLDFGEYQSHSLYISRYPYGREATLGFPHPDLEIKNTTPHGVLIWTSYTPTTITVDMFSTRFAEGAQTGQTTAPRGPCTRVTTQRTRTYVDGTRKVDTVSALYRPREGVNCP